MGCWKRCASLRLAQLDASPEADAVRERHAGYVLEMAQSAERACYAGDWLQILEREHGNVGGSTCMAQPPGRARRYRARGAWLATCRRTRPVLVCARSCDGGPAVAGTRLLGAGRRSCLRAAARAGAASMPAFWPGFKAIARKPHRIYGPVRSCLNRSATGGTGLDSAWTGACRALSSRPRCRRVALPGRLRAILRRERRGRPRLGRQRAWPDRADARTERARRGAIQP